MHMETAIAVAGRARSSHSPPFDWYTSAVRRRDRGSRAPRYNAILVSLLVATVTSTATAGADTLPAYPDLMPARIRVERNAAAITAACSAARKANQTNCLAYEFCNEPLKPKPPATDTPAPLEFLYPVLEEANITGSICPPDKNAVDDKGFHESVALGAAGSTWESEALSELAVFLVERAKAEALAVSSGSACPTADFRSHSALASRLRRSYAVSASTAEHLDSSTPYS